MKTNVWHVTLTDGSVLGVWCDTKAEARIFAHARLRDDEDPTGVRSVEKVAGSSITLDYGTTLRY